MTRYRVALLLLAASLGLFACGPELTATYTATIEPAEFEEYEVPVPEFGGRWTLTLDDEEGTYNMEVEGFGVDGAISEEEGKLTFDDPPAPEGAFVCFVDGKRTMDVGTGTYRFELTDETLRLIPEEEHCPFRKLVLARTWSAAR